MQDLILQLICLVIMFACFLYLFRVARDFEKLLKAKNMAIESQLEELEQLRIENTEMSFALIKIERKYDIQLKNGEYIITEKNKINHYE